MDNLSTEDYEHRGLTGTDEEKEQLLKFAVYALHHLRNDYWWYRRTVREARTPRISRSGVDDLLRIARDFGFDTEKYLNGE